MIRLARCFREELGCQYKNVRVSNRTGVLAGQTIPWPGFDNIAKPLLGLLGTTQAVLLTEDEVGVQDAEVLARQEKKQVQRSAALVERFTARLTKSERP